MKRLFRIVGIVLLVIAIGVTILVASYLRHRNAIVGDWSEPRVTLEVAHRCANPDRNAVFVEYFFGIGQRAERKYPYRVWEGTAWEQEITSRSHHIASGWEQAIVDLETNEVLLRLPISKDTAQTVFASGAGWIVFEQSNIQFVTGDTIKTLLENQGHIASITRSDEPDEIVFLVYERSKAECLSLNLTTLQIESRYVFNTSATGPPNEVLVLDEDCERTVVVANTVHRANHGTIGVGINATDGTPLRVISPESMVPSATAYSWYHLPEDNEIVIRFDEPSASTWVLDLETLTTSQATRPEVPPSSGIAFENPNNLTPSVREALASELMKQYAEGPFERNLYRRANE